MAALRLHPHPLRPAEVEGVEGAGGCSLRHLQHGALQAAAVRKVAAAEAAAAAGEAAVANWATLLQLPLSWPLQQQQQQRRQWCPLPPPALPAPAESCP